MSRPDCVIVGGGVIGLSIAWQLAKEKLRVQVVDRRRCGEESSWAGVGILPPANLSTARDPIDRLRALSHQLHRQWADELREITGIDNGFRESGGIYLATTRGEAASLMGLADYWSEYEIEAIPLSQPRLADLESQLATTEVQGTAWHLPDETQVRSPLHLKALRAACELRGVTFLESHAVEDFVIANDQIVAAKTDTQELPGAVFCVTSGAWSQRLLSKLSLEAGIYPVRGQVLLYQLDTPPITRIINEGNRYLVPRDDGHLLVGSNEEEVGFETGTTEEVVDDLRSWAERLVPILKGKAVVQSWSGFRPGSYDGLPFIGKIPGLSNAFVSTGHYRSGLHLSCATATEMACLIQGKTTRLDLSLLSPIRG